MKLSVSRKAGGPGYGSDGASAEVEVEIEGAAAAIDPMRRPGSLPSSRPWPPSCRMQDRAAPGTTITAGPPSPRRHSHARTRWDPDDLPPARPLRETGEDNEPLREQDRPPNGYDDRRGARKIDPPRSGKQLLGWAYSHGADAKLKASRKAGTSAGSSTGLSKMWTPPTGS